MSGLGLPAPMFGVFAATILVGSLGAIHYLIVHVWMGRPFQEIPPPVVREGRLADDAADAADGADGADGAGGGAEGGAGGGAGRPGGGVP